MTKQEKTTDTTDRVLIVLAHPNMAESKANKALLKAVRDLPDIEVLDLYAASYDRVRSLNAIAEAKALVYQFPFYWASAPSELKRWIDDVFMEAALQGTLAEKPMMVAVTAASEFDAYRSGGRNQFTVDELLRPYQMSANHAGMIWQTPHVVYGLGTSEAASSIRKGAEIYRGRIEGL